MVPSPIHEEPVRDCLLTVTGDNHVTLSEQRAVVPPNPERSVLERLYREHIDGHACRYAIAQEGRTIRALYLAEDLIPEEGVRLAGRKARVSRWVTTAIPLGASHAGRIFLGPELFFRQIDITGAESWLAPILMRFGQDAEVREQAFGADRLYDWEVRGERYYYWARGGRWALFGAGNTSPERIDRLFAGGLPDRPWGYLWSIGAIPLAGRSPGLADSPIRGTHV